LQQPSAATAAVWLPASANLSRRGRKQRRTRRFAKMVDSQQPFTARRSNFGIRSPQFRARRLPVLVAALWSASSWAAVAGTHDIVIRNAEIFDGSGKPPFAGDVAIDGDRISYVGPRAHLNARTEIDAKGQAVAPGFINMLAHPEESRRR
jgi:hypothetical protein